MLRIEFWSRWFMIPTSFNASRSHSSGRNFIFLWDGQVHLFSYSRIESESTTTLVTKVTNRRWKQQTFQPTETKKSLNFYFITLGHRRTGNFRPGGAVNHLPKKLLQVAQIFIKQSTRNKGHTMQQHRPYWHTKVPQYSFSGSIYTCQVWA